MRCHPFPSRSLRSVLLGLALGLAIAACGSSGGGQADGAGPGADAVAADSGAGDAGAGDARTDDVGAEVAAPADARVDAASDVPAPPDTPPADVPPQPPLTLAVGVAVRDVTPTFEPYTDENGNLRWDEGEPFEDGDDDGALDTLYVGGFTVRQPTGVHDPLTVRAFALQLGTETWVFAAVDALGLSLGRIEAIKERVLAAAPPALGLTEAHLVVASTHTHHAPDSIGIFGPESLEGAWDEAYLSLVVERTSEAIGAALAALEPAELVVTEATAGEGYVRDLDPPDILDPSVGILQARALGEERVILTAVSIANHPETIWKQNTLISADYPGVLRAALEERFGGTAVFFAGALGLMQSPAEVGEAGFERAELIGTAYADLVTAAIEAAAPLPADELRPAAAFDRVTAPLENVELFAGIRLGVVDGYDEYLYKGDQEPCKLMGCIDAPVTVLRLGAHLTIVTIPGEATPELVVGGIVSPPDYEGPYADAPAEPTVAEHLATPHRFVIGLANCEVGYLYPKRTHDPPNHFSQNHGPGPNAAAYVMAGVARLMDEVNAAFAD